MKWVELLEKKLTEWYGKFGDEAELKACGIPEAWHQYPWCYQGYGPRDGCINECGPFWTDDVLRGICAMFRAALSVVRDEVDSGGWTVVEPSLEDCSTMLICDKGFRHVLYQDDVKAWNFQFETPEELNQELEEIHEICMELADAVGITKKLCEPDPNKPMIDGLARINADVIRRAETGC